MSGKHLRASQRTSLTRTSTSRCAAYCFGAHMLRQREALPHTVWHTLTLIAFLQEDEGDDEEKDGEPRENRQAVPCNKPWRSAKRLQRAQHAGKVTLRTCDLHRQKRLVAPGAKRKARPAARGAGASPRGEPSDRQIRRSAPAAYPLEVP